MVVVMAAAVAVPLPLLILVGVGSVLVVCYYGWRKKRKTRKLDITCCESSVTVSNVRYTVPKM